MGYKVAVVGATGNVGREMLNILAEREFPADEVFALASRRSINATADSAQAPSTLSRTSTKSPGRDSSGARIPAKSSSARRYKIALSRSREGTKWPAITLSSIARRDAVRRWRS